MAPTGVVSGGRGDGVGVAEPAEDAGVEVEDMGDVLEGEAEGEVLEEEVEVEVLEAEVLERDAAAAFSMHLR
jgi:hypothetical protein